jgi:hypothetical protein
MYAQPPDAPSTFSKPSAPYCLSGYRYSGKHTCDNWEIQSYIDEINEYIRKLNEYAEEARDFAQNAINFADEANEYAGCEANEAKEELQ